MFGLTNETRVYVKTGVTGTTTNLSDLLMGNELGITIYQGSPSWLWMLLVTIS